MAKNKKPETNTEKKKCGRPTLYNEAVGQKICDLIATTDMGLRKICDNPDLPAYITITHWLLNDNHPFSKQYARAKEQQAEVLGDQIISIADEVKPTDKFSVEKAKLQVDARKFVAAKLKPKKWGDRIYQEHTGADGQAIKIENQEIDLSALSQEELLLFKSLSAKIINKKAE